jgi:hypothetical protein
MAEFALINPHGEIDRTARDIDPTVPTKAGWRWIPVEITRPSTSSTQILEGPVVTILDDKVTRIWSVRERTADELEAIKDRQVDGVNQLTVAIGLDHENRIRALEGKPAVTLAQFRAALKARL